MGSNSFEKISFDTKYPLAKLPIKKSFKTPGCKAYFCLFLPKEHPNVFQWVRHGGRTVGKACLFLFLQCQLAVIPLGTGNDLARVLGWGAFWNKSKSPVDILNRVEQAHVRILDRWVTKRTYPCASSICIILVQKSAIFLWWKCRLIWKILSIEKSESHEPLKYYRSPSPLLNDHRAGASQIHFKGLVHVIQNVTCY